LQRISALGMASIRFPHFGHSNTVNRISAGFGPCALVIAATPFISKTGRQALVELQMFRVYLLGMLTVISGQFVNPCE